MVTGPARLLRHVAVRERSEIASILLRSVSLNAVDVEMRGGRMKVSEVSLDCPKCSAPWRLSENLACPNCSSARQFSVGSGNPDGGGEYDLTWQCARCGQSGNAETRPRMVCQKCGCDVTALAVRNAGRAMHVNDKAFGLVAIALITILFVILYVVKR